MLTSKEIADILESQISYHRRLIKVKTTTAGTRKSPRKKIVKKNWFYSQYYAS